MLQAAEDHHATQARLAGLAVAAATRLVIDPGAITASWGAAVAAVLRVTVAAQITAAAAAEAYTVAALAEQNLPDAPDAGVRLTPLAGVAGDGRPLDSLADQPRIAALAAIAGGLAPVLAVRSAITALGTMMATAVQDAGRAAESLSIVTRPEVGYVRMLNPPSCSRCVVLAGKFYRWNAGFDRHPRDDCRHLPSTEDAAGDLRTSPRAYFDSLTEVEQDRQFTQAGALAIRDGADIAQVVNARRGAAGMATAGRLTVAEQRALRGGRDRARLTTTDVFGQQLPTTTEGTTVRGTAGRSLAARGGAAPRAEGDRYRRARAPRLMPEGIYQVATDREDALRLLRRNGYLI